MLHVQYEFFVFEWVPKVINNVQRSTNFTTLSK